MDGTGSSLSARPLHPVFGAEISGLDIRKALAPSAVKDVIAAMDRYAICLYRNDSLSDDEHIAFSRYFGPLQHAPRIRDNTPRLGNRPELFDAGNLDENGKILAKTDLRRSYAEGNKFWHTDSSFNQNRAAY